MVQKQIWLGIPLFPVLVMFLIPCLVETSRAPSDLPEAEAESVGLYQLSNPRFLVQQSKALFILHSKLMNVGSGVYALL